MANSAHVELPIYPPKAEGIYIYPAPPGPLDYAFCIRMRNMVADAIEAALKSGVLSYHVGSRGLQRYSLADLQSMLDYWITKANDALTGGSSIKCKRGVPCDV
jgi:hypothetical protein